MSKGYVLESVWTIETKLVGSKKRKVKIKSNLGVPVEFRVEMESVIKEVSSCYPTVEVDGFRVTEDKTSIEVKIEDNKADKNYLLWEVVQRFKILSTQRYLEGVEKKGWAELTGKLWSDLD